MTPEREASIEVKNNCQIFLFSLVLLLAALWGARSHAQSRLQSLEELKTWRHQLSLRQDLDEREKDLRIEFVDHLMFQVERKQGDQDLKTALQSILADMKETAQLKTNQAFATKTAFLENLHLSYLNLIEKNERPLPFVQAFVEFSGLSEPATMDQFASTRNYSDGRRLIPANPKDPEEAARILEQKEAEKAKPLPYRLFTEDPPLQTIFQNRGF
jgi:hypothetical protein